MRDETCAVLVVGGGPGGYAAAIRCGQLGLDAVLVEGRDLGGTCLNVGCIPSKALLHAAGAYAAVAGAANGRSPFGIRVDGASIDLPAAVAWKDSVVAGLQRGIASLLAKARVRVVRGWATVLDGKTVLVSSDGTARRFRTEHLVLATGSVPVELPVLPYGGSVLSSTEALALTELPERLAVVGGGYIGLELGTAFAKLGSAVTIVEMAGRVLPAFDRELVDPVARRLQELGASVLTDTEVLGLGADGVLHIKGPGGTTSDVAADRVLVTVGRSPRTDGWGLEVLDIDRDGPAVRVDSSCRTSMNEVYAVGDLTGEPMLAHRAVAQGTLVAETIAGMRRIDDHVCVPAVVFTDPEIVSVGMTAEAARASGIDVVEGRFPFSAIGGALAAGDSSGFVRAVARATDHVLLGVQAVGARGTSELAAAFALAMEMGARLEDVAGTIHAHPTRGEAFHEAALHGLGHALHA